ncbi:MAG TPA: sulfatase-like hydrolase/transferase [Armatimonadota bacterium]|nr:sulfatase-like hydrolase/transferase [Armatimonadota bacterium]HQK92837.1 sulfatase-like hydrolase/transferase [Armatimonadota bacterium]
MDRPNILIFMTDQQRGDTALAGSPAHMPNLARMRSEGVTFSNAFCPAPHCCPSRATFHTGLYPSEHGVWNNVDVGNALSRGLAPGTRLWSDDLREAGYALSFSGKWHISAVETPADRGWQMGFPEPRPTVSAEEVASGRPHTREWAMYERLAGQPEAAVRHEGEILRPGYGTYTHYGTSPHAIVEFDEHTVEDAFRVIHGRRVSEGPWCQFVGTLGPHDPYFAPADFVGRYDPGDVRLPDNFGDRMEDKPALYRRTRDRFDQLSEREHREALRHYLAFCSYEDALFGRLLGALEERGELDRTLVIYLSDHGDYGGEHGLWCKGLPCFRSAYHVPAVIRWPDGIREPGRVVDAFVSLADFAPTLLEAAGIGAGRPLSGQSLMPFLRDEPPAQWRDALFTQTNGNELYGIQRSVMTREWKYVYNGFDYDELYDLRNDPGETRNVIGDPAHADVVRELCARMWEFAHAHRDVCINPYIMVAHAPVGPAAAFGEFRRHGT